VGTGPNIRSYSKSEQHNPNFNIMKIKTRIVINLKKYKICIYAISKNEEKFVNRWADSMSEADEIVVTDTGSTDKTVEKLRSRGIKVFEEKINPWRFDLARNISLSHVPDDMDIVMCTDIDEILKPGWRECIEKAWTPETTSGNYLFNFNFNEDGTPHTQLICFKVHLKKSYKWVWPIHECLEFIPNEIHKQEKKVFINGMIIEHYPDITKSRSSYLKLLELGVKEYPLSDRMAYYLGREYMYAGKWQDSIDTLKRHLELPSAQWKEERCASMRWIAICYRHLKHNHQAYSWHYRAIAEILEWRDPYTEFAETAYFFNDWLTVCFMTERALKINKKSFYIDMGYSWDHTLDDLAAIANYKLGNFKKSLIHAENALKFKPNDERLKKNFEFIKQTLI
jgi:glycosyltransferase involved in cell wall biosynthesis